MRPTFYGIGSRIDNPDYWNFTRNSKLPRAAFEPQRPLEVIAWAIVVGVGVAAGALAVIIGNFI